MPGRCELCVRAAHLELHHYHTHTQLSCTKSQITWSYPTTTHTHTHIHGSQTIMEEAVERLKVPGCGRTRAKEHLLDIDRIIPLRKSQQLWLPAQDLCTRSS